MTGSTSGLATALRTIWKLMPPLGPCSAAITPRSTPPGGTGHDPRQMFRRGHDGELLQCLTEGLNLRAQPVQRVPVALDLVPLNASVDHGHIDSTLCVRKAQFVDHQRVRMGPYTAQALGMKCETNAGVSGSKLGHGSYLYLPRTFVARNEMSNRVPILPRLVLAVDFKGKRLSLDGWNSPTDQAPSRLAPTRAVCTPQRVIRRIPPSPAPWRPRRGKRPGAWAGLPP